MKATQSKATQTSKYFIVTQIIIDYSVSKTMAKCSLVTGIYTHTECLLACDMVHETNK